MSNSNSKITNKPTVTKMTLGLSAIVAAMFATSAFAEPPIQPGDTLESLSKATVQTTINGQPGSLEQMGIPKQVIAQAIAQNAVIDLQARTLRPMNAPVSSSMQASSQSPQSTMQSEQSAMTEAQNQLAQAQSTAEQVAVEDAEINTAVDTAINEADQTVATAQAEVQAVDQNAAALMPEADQNAIDPNAQAVPAEDMSKTVDATQLAEPEMDATTPLQ